MPDSSIAIPPSIQREHGEIHAALEEASRAPGGVGAAAKEVVAVMRAHFVREEQIALPELGLIASLASGDAVPENILLEALAMTAALKTELPRMLEEHNAMRVAVEKLRAAARAAQAARYEELADHLALHAEMEEEVLYPAALLVGELIRARRQAK